MEGMSSLEVEELLDVEVEVEEWLDCWPSIEVEVEEEGLEVEELVPLVVVEA